MMNCEDEIDDVIGETYLALCEHTEKNGLPNNPTAWLYSVLNRRINEKFRKLYKEKNNRIHIDDIYELPFEIDFDEEMLKKIPIDKLKKTLFSELSEQDLELYEYIYIKNLKYKQIAKKENISESAVKQRHYRLCNKIKNLAKKICYEIEL